METGEIVPETCRTEVFLFPAASHVEKEGTFTQTQRMLQWREQGGRAGRGPPLELWFIYHLGRKLRARLAGSPTAGPAGARLLGLRATTEDGEPSGRGRAAADQRVDLTTGRAVGDYLSLKADGSTVVRVLDLQRRVRRRGQPGRPAQTARRAGAARPGVGLDVAAEPADALQPGVRRPPGPAVERAQEAHLVGRRAGEWTGHDVPDFEQTKPPDYRPPEGAVGAEALRGDDPFIMQADGKGWLFAPNGLVDGPLPTHYEPHESPVRNPLYAAAGEPGAEGVRAGG